jgi:hypothetical protein
MTFDRAKIEQGKREFHQRLAARPISEKLRMLDALRERELAIRGRVPHAESSILREDAAPYRTKPE